VEGIPLDLEALWGESDPKIPMICLLSQGSDPTSAIQELAKKHKIELRAVSMGQGQESVAREMLQQGITNGGWVILQNCHLALKVLGVLCVSRWCDGYLPVSRDST
jgi:dynein heavy chain